MNMEDKCTTRDCRNEAKPGFGGKCFTCGINGIRKENGLVPIEKDDTPAELRCTDCGTPASEVKSFNEEKKKCRSCLVKATKVAKRTAAGTQPEGGQPGPAPSEKGVFTERDRERERERERGQDNMSTPEKDMVNHPPHYTQGKIEVIDFIEDKGLDFLSGNVVKYVVRAPHKGSALEDLKKARWYLDRLIKKNEEETL